MNHFKLRVLVFLVIHPELYSLERYKQCFEKYKNGTVKIWLFLKEYVVYNMLHSNLIKYVFDE